MAHETDDLAELFAEARQTAPRPSADLTTRVLADAAEVQAELAPSRPGVRGGGWFGAALGALGGWPGVSGLAMAGVSGIMIGVYATDVIDLALNGQLTVLVGGDSSGLLPGIDGLGVGVEEG